MTRFSSADLYFAYRDDRAKLCCELHGLADDEIEVLLVAMQRRFDQSEPDAFTFAIKTNDDYSPLECVKRRRGGEWVDSGIEGKGMRLAMSAAISLNISLNIDNQPELTDDQRRWLDVHRIAWAMSGETNQLRVELNCHKPIKSSILPTISREELLAHLDGVEYSPPKMPAVPEQPRADTPPATDDAEPANAPAGYMSVADIMAALNLPEADREPARKRLERWRENHPDGGDWFENGDPKRGEPRYLYRFDAVREVVKPSGERPSRKK